jgi:hypothetical protein
MGGKKPFALADEEAWIRVRVAEKPDITGRELLAELTSRGVDVSYYGEKVWTGLSRRRRKRSKPQFGAGSQICRNAVSVPVWRCGVEVKPRSREAGPRRRRA